MDNNFITWREYFELLLNLLRRFRIFWRYSLYIAIFLIFIIFMIFLSENLNNIILILLIVFISLPIFKYFFKKEVVAGNEKIIFDKIKFVKYIISFILASLVSYLIYSAPDIVRGVVGGGSNACPGSPICITPGALVYLSIFIFSFPITFYLVSKVLGVGNWIITLIAFGLAYVVFSYIGNTYFSTPAIQSRAIKAAQTEKGIQRIYESCLIDTGKMTGYAPDKIQVFFKKGITETQAEQTLDSFNLRLLPNNRPLGYPSQVEVPYGTALEWVCRFRSLIMTDKAIISDAQLYFEKGQ